MCPGSERLVGEARGVVGLHLAHKQVWKTIADRNETSFVFEDDAALTWDLLRNESARHQARSMIYHAMGGNALTKPPSANDMRPPALNRPRAAFRELMFLGYWGHTCTHAYILTPAGAARLLRHNRQICDPKWPVDAAMHQLGCGRSYYGGEMGCTYALPTVRNGPDTRFDGIVKQRISLFDRAAWSFRRLAGDGDIL